FWGQRKAQGAKAVLELPIVQLNCSYLVLFSSAWSRGATNHQPFNCIAALQAYKVHSGRMLWGGVKTEACPPDNHVVFSPNTPEVLEQCQPLGLGRH
ncbi:MAG: hypothetical protein KKC02_01800, partial [Gammaproteobacteria bacterium]|nr:hypothetical protein [Gammaproteobacteria bacterium]